MRFRDVLILLTGIALVWGMMEKTGIGNKVISLFSSATRGLRNNNPGNIRKSSTTYVGEVVGNDPEFKTFATIEYGYRAIYMVLNTYRVKYGLTTVAGIIGRWAPASENPTGSYVSFVAKKAGVNPNDQLVFSKEQLKGIVAGITKFENGIDPLPAHLEDGYKLFYA